MTLITPPIFEFHISRRARERYQFDETLFSTNGNVIFANFHATRQFAQKMNKKRDLARFPEQAVRAGQINAMGLIDEILHLVASQYRAQYPAASEQLLPWLYEKVGETTVRQTLRNFAEHFPPSAVYRREIALDDYLRQTSGALPTEQVVLEELLMLWLANANPAFNPFTELFDDSDLGRESGYRQLVPALHEFFSGQPPFGPDHQSLPEMLRSPAIAFPHSLDGQLEYIRTRWSGMLGQFLYRLLSSMDFIREEEKALAGGALLGPGPAQVLEFGGADSEPERFSPDKDWMPRVVLMAKNAFVWLDQLSKKHRRSLTTLADIPDDELDALARGGFTGLWLIGLWERSNASKNIKIMRGNPDAVASAYSLADYSLATDLGGEEAYQNLRHRCWQRGIRLASDMVPNHMGIDSRWVIEHPQWFVGLDYPPFPAYTFNGPNFSGNDRVGIYIEDHYFDNSDAAVVFKRVDFNTGATKYIYHGNDGTSMPWNDTAQLNYLLADVREAVIQTILHVARKFPIIRFDAAMTLAKKHYQRLWFPEPGTGGAIPSRAEFGLTRDQFDAAFPLEFWREVVDRVAQEVPDTLLLAEAFWLMEGYFVRTLGMHRVYNSAFMNMLRDEKNQEYRLVIKNTLEFDPEILKRYVNFMNNPDERTAVDQFGKGDKYFGVCTLMSTLPGLPMFGHGQLEGFTEKYGMEYRRAYWDETPETWLLDRHARQIYPLLRQRALFSGVEHFLLYDCFTPEGSVNEDVFAYSNQQGDAKSLVVYHNRYASARGWLRTSAGYAVKTENGEKQVASKTLAEGLQIENDNQLYTIFRDLVSGLEYLRPNRELCQNGLFVELEAYTCRVFLDFRTVADNAFHQYRQLNETLQGRGVPSVDEALKALFLQPIHHNFRELAHPNFFAWLAQNRSTYDATGEWATPATQPAALQECKEKTLALLHEIRRVTSADSNPAAIAAEISDNVLAALETSEFFTLPAPKETPELDSETLPAAEPAADADFYTLLGWLFTQHLGRAAQADGWRAISRSWLDEWQLGKLLTQTLLALGLDDAAAWRALSLIKILITHGQWWSEASQKLPAKAARAALQTWLADPDVQQFIGVNRWQGVLWFNKEAFEELVRWLERSARLQLACEKQLSLAARFSDQASQTAVIEKLLVAGERSGYRVERLLEAEQSAANG